MKNSIFSFLAVTIEERTGMHYEDISLDTKIREVCDSLEVLEVLEAAEKRYGIFIDTEDFYTVGDLVNIILANINV